MEPLLPDDPSGHLEALACALIERSASLSASVHEQTARAIADFLRPMNSYYSNLIEGHDTHPIDIDKALKGDFSNDKIKRDFQQEAHAHINVHKYLQEHIDSETLPMPPSSAAFLQFIHHAFYAHLPESFRTVTSEDGVQQQVIPGEFRKAEVKVGRHIAPAHAHLSDFIKRFSTFYDPAANENRNKVRRIIAIAASHHRLAWIHPFLDGNGRVVRLFSDAEFMREGLDASGLWSISRGLAKNNTSYKAQLANADAERRSDFDGRGNLSNQLLIEFCSFFLEAAIDQIEYMRSILDTDTITARLDALSELLMIKKSINRISKHILIDVFLKGSISKSDVMRITNTSDKTAKILTDQLEELGLLSSISEPGKKTIYLPKYPISLSPSIFPGLYPSSKETDLLNSI